MMVGPSCLPRSIWGVPADHRGAGMAGVNPRNDMSSIRIPAPWDQPQPPRRTTYRRPAPRYVFVITAAELREDEQRRARELLGDMAPR